MREQGTADKGRARRGVLAVLVVAGIALSSPAAALGDGEPTISGPDPPYEHHTLTGDEGSNAGTFPVRSPQWRRCEPTTMVCEDIPGETGGTYTVVEEDIGKQLVFEVRCADAVLCLAAGSPLPETSEPTDVVRDAAARITSLSVTRSDSERIASVTVDGNPPPSPSFAWLRCTNRQLSSCAAIPGANGSRYTPSAADEHGYIRVRVRVANADGSDEEFSAPEGPIPGSRSGFFFSPEPPPPPPSPLLLSPFPRVAIAGRAYRFTTRLSKLAVRAPRGARITVRCRGRGCPYRRASASGRGRFLRFRRMQRTFRRGTAVAVFVTHRRLIGKYTRFRFRRRRAPARVDRCLGPGSTTPVHCPTR